MSHYEEMPMQTWHQPQNYKYMMYCNISRGISSTSDSTTPWQARSNDLAECQAVKFFLLFLLLNHSLRSGFSETRWQGSLLDDRTDKTQSQLYLYG